MSLPPAVMVWVPALMLEVPLAPPMLLALHSGALGVAEACAEAALSPEAFLATTTKK
jgi:hypothetical protein